MFDVKKSLNMGPRAVISLSAWRPHFEALIAHYPDRAGKYPPVSDKFSSSYPLVLIA